MRNMIIDDNRSPLGLGRCSVNVQKMMKIHGCSQNVRTCWAMFPPFGSKVSFKALGFYSPGKLSASNAMNIMEAYMASCLTAVESIWGLFRIVKDWEKV